MGLVLDHGSKASPDLSAGGGSCLKFVKISSAKCSKARYAC